MKKITLLFFATIISTFSWSQCVKDNPFGNLALTNDGSIELIAPNQWTTEHSEVTGFVEGNDYLIIIDQVSDGTNKFVTISELGNDANVLAFGQSPFNFTATSIADLKLSWSDDLGPDCAGTQVSHRTAVQNLTIAADLCPDPINFDAANITDTTADLTWTEEGIAAVSYNVEVYASGESAGGGNTPVFADAGVSGTSVMATGLMESSDYDAYITTTCSGATASSMLVGPIAFTTTASCSDATDLGTANLSDTMADITWTPGTGNDSALVEVYASGESAANGDTPVYTNAAASGGSETASGLMGDTMYDAYVTGFCGATGTALQGPESFTTTPPLPVCGGSFVDSGGSGANYSNDEVTTWTICPDNPGDIVTVDFTFFSTENNGTGCYDGLTIHDGPDTMATTIDPPAGGTIWCWDRNDTPANGSGDLQGMMISSSDASGCLTFVFTSDLSVTREGWEAAVTCAPPPTCLQPTDLVVDTLTETQVDFSWVDEPGATLGYDIELGTPGFAPGTGVELDSGSVGIGVTSSSFTGLTANTDYEIYVRSNCDANGLSLWAGPLEFFTGYCIPTGTSNLSFIDNFSTTLGITNISNLGSGFATDNYQDNFNTSEVTTFATGSFEFDIEIQGGTQGCAIWVDWNNDLVFDVSEVQFSTTGFGSGPFMGSITVPGGTPNGDYRMRVMVDWNDSNPGDDDACGFNAGRGEVEDYKIVVGDAPTDVLDFFSLWFPPNGTIDAGGDFNVFAQCFEAGLTEGTNGQAPGIECWIGYNDADTDPSGVEWTWIPAGFNVETGNNDNNDEYILNLGPEINATGTYYYAARWRLNGGLFTYGGIQADGSFGGEWGDNNNISGVLTITPPSNDACAGAIVINDGDMIMGDTTFANNIEALTECEGGGGGDTGCDGGTGILNFGAGLWYVYTAGPDEAITVTTDNSPVPFDTEIQIFSGDCTNLVCVGGDDDGGDNAALSTICWESTATMGTTVDYYIYVDGHLANSGEFQLDLTVQSTLTVEDFDKDSFTYYPNPVTDDLSLRAQETIQNVRVLNILGQEVMRIAPNTVETNLNMSSLNDGAYFVQVMINNKTETVRIIKN